MGLVDDLEPFLRGTGVVELFKGELVLLLRVGLVELVTSDKESDEGDSKGMMNMNDVSDEYMLMVFKST